MPRRHALIIQHHPVETLGDNFAAVLRGAGFGLTTLPLYAAAPDFAAAAFDAAPDLAGVDLIIALGGPMSANDDCPALRQETAYLRAAAIGRRQFLPAALRFVPVATATGKTRASVVAPTRHSARR